MRLFKRSSVPHVLELMMVAEIRAVIGEAGASCVDDRCTFVTPRATASAAAASRVGRVARVAADCCRQRCNRGTDGARLSAFQSLDQNGDIAGDSAGKH
jgi:hypothetical protein